MRSVYVYRLFYMVMRDDHKNKLKKMLKEEKIYSMDEIHDYLDSLKEYYVIPTKRELEKDRESALGNCLCNIKHLTKEQRLKIWKCGDELLQYHRVFGG